MHDRQRTVNLESRGIGISLRWKTVLTGPLTSTVDFLSLLRPLWLFSTGVIMDQVIDAVENISGD